MDKFDIIIASGGKCGSSTLFKTFKHNGYTTLHTHGKFVDYNINSINELINIQKNNTIYVIDSYRTPIERHISAFFQNIHTYILKPFNKININMLIYWFNKYYIDCDNYHPLDNFIPIFNDSTFNFDKEYIKKIIKIQEKNIIYIKLRFNSINMWDKILSEIFDNPITIVNDNISDNKNYSEIYKLFLNNYMVPIEYLNNIESFDTFQRYNSLLEKTNYIKKWMSKSIEKDIFLEKINSSMFENIPEDFKVEVYKQINNLNYYNDVDALIHWEFIGYYKNYHYKYNYVINNNVKNIINKILKINEENNNNEEENNNNNEQEKLNSNEEENNNNNEQEKLNNNEQEKLNNNEQENNNNNEQELKENNIL